MCIVYLYYRTDELLKLENVYYNWRCPLDTYISNSIINTQTVSSTVAPTPTVYKDVYFLGYHTFSTICHSTFKKYKSSCIIINLNQQKKPTNLDCCIILMKRQSHCFKMIYTYIYIAFSLTFNT